MSADRSILVTGDFICDHHIYEGDRFHFGDHRHRGVQIVEELGGAALVHYLLSKMTGSVHSYLGVGLSDPESRLPRLAKGESVPPSLSAYAIWRPYGPSENATPEKKMWRTEDAMGFGCVSESKSSFQWPKPTRLSRDPDVVVLSDGGMGFREQSSAWPGDAILDRARWIVLKTTHPLAAGPLWDHLFQPKYRSKLALVISASDLRRGEVQLSGGLSWEATVESTMRVLSPGGAYACLAQCRHLFIAFGTEGGLWLEGGSAFSKAQAHLVYAAESVEGEHRMDEKGKAFGALSCLAAAGARHLAVGIGQKIVDLQPALEGGLSAMYDLLEKGHGPAMASGGGFPAKRLAKATETATCRYSWTTFAATAPLDSPTCAVKAHGASGCWSVMHQSLQQMGQSCPEPAWSLAELVARHGPIALGSRPHLRIGNLVSADRREIESLRILRRMILEYKNRRPSDCKKPLSIGVFGPPGSGKSFAVKEIAQALAGKEGWLEFNLSQFREDTTEDLIGAFHQIRDRVLRAQLPVAFFDEFDSRDYAWLQFLLAPMQDGAFQQGQITHPIGKCIFIFAGATSRTFDSFGPSPKDGKAFDAFRMAKGPDFKSRLDGFLDILGPNPREIVQSSAKGTGYSRTLDPCDIFYPIRRALVIRAEFRCKPEDELALDLGLLRALLRTKTYKHGARSLGKLIEPLKTGWPSAISRSLLPPKGQLDLHVDGDDFLRECEKPVMRPIAAKLNDPEIVARQIHETYRRLGLDQGWMKKGSERDVGYDELHDFYKRSNLEAAARMARTLSIIGLTLVKGKGTPAERSDIRMRIEYPLALLAQAEHDGWMDWHLDQGWRFGSQKPTNPPTKEPNAKTHPCLRPYMKLSDEERNKDRDAVRHYSEFAAAAGMKIVLANWAAPKKKTAPASGRARRAKRRR